MRDRLLAGLREHIRRCTESGDTSMISSLDAGYEADALVGPGTGFDAEAYHAAGTVRWLRYRAAAPGEGIADLAAALRLFGAVLDAGAPYDVPAPMRLILECRGDA